jgi:hypothetical protein
VLTGSAVDGQSARGTEEFDAGRGVGEDAAQRDGFLVAGGR